MGTWTTSSIPDQSGKLAIITGATGGLGLETAMGLVEAGADVILAGRNPAKGRNAEALIRQKYKNAKVRFELADMASLTSIKDFSDSMLAAAASALPERLTSRTGNAPAPQETPTRPEREIFPC